MLAFTAPEALYLAEQGFTDIVVAYPTVDRAAIAQVARMTATDPDRAPVLMVDDRPHLDLIEGAIGGGPAKVRVCLDIDVSWWPLGGRVARVGPKRSPIHDPVRAARMAAEIAERPGTELAGLMAYEGQIAGVGDRIAGRPLRSAAIRLMQSRSEAEIRSPAAADRRRGARVARRARPRARVHQRRRHRAAWRGPRRRGSSPSSPPARASTPRRCSTTTARSRSSRPRCSRSGGPPAGRRASPPCSAAATSPPAAPGRDRLPDPYLPGGLRFDREEGAGEVQTPVSGAAAYKLRVGDRVYLRHAKAGELCERFDSLYLVEGERIVDQVPTYRGEGKTFL